jgi:glycosyltransferase involved in cell wall biosynthesis
MEKARVALIHDWFPVRRGGEKVFEVFAEIFPRADIFSLFHIKGSQVEALESRGIRTSFIQSLPFLKTRFRHYLPLFPMAAESFNLQEYDLVISSSHCAAKGVIPRPDALHISYVHSPVRYAWNQYHSYFPPGKMGVFSRFVIPPIIHYLRMWDVTASARVDAFAANSRAVAARIDKYYRRNAQVIHPPVDTEYFIPGEKRGDYFLIVSALVPYKKVELAIHAFNRSGLPLKIVGMGPEYKTLRRMAGANVEFLGFLEDKDLLLVYQGAKALIMPGEEDFGINVLECQSCGVPVIALGRGGVRDTVVPGETGVFFNHPTVPSLLGALDKFQDIEFNRETVRANALGFSREAFKERITEYFRGLWNEHKKEQDR